MRAREAASMTFPPHLASACRQFPATQEGTEKCHHLSGNRLRTQLVHPNLSAAYHYSWMQPQVN